MKLKRHILNKIISVIAIVFFGFILWHHIDYLIDYYRMINGDLEICFATPAWESYASIILSAFSIILSWNLFKEKIKLLKYLLLIFLIGIIMTVIGIGLIMI